MGKERATVVVSWVVIIRRPPGCTKSIRQITFEKHTGRARRRRNNNIILRLNSILALPKGKKRVKLCTGSECRLEPEFVIKSKIKPKTRWHFLLNVGCLIVMIMNA